MRRVSQFMVAVVAVCALAVPAEARQQQNDSWFVRQTAPAVKQIKKIIRALGDGLTIPKP